MHKFVSALGLGFILFSSAASADFLGIYAGGGSWKHDPSGDFSSNTGTPIDVSGDLNYGSKSESYAWIAFDHPLPLIPNIRLEKTSLSQSGDLAVTAGRNFNGAASGASSITLDSTDAILYYRLLDNWVNLDFGLNLRKIDGDFTVGSEVVNFSESIPMVYLAAQFDLPFSGFSVGADMNVISYSGSTYNDIRLRALYEMGVIGFEVGTRTTTLTLDNVDGIDADLEFSGLMLGMFLHF